MGAGSILIISHEPTFRRRVTDAVKGLGHPVRGATPGEALGLDLETISFVLCDFDMPVMDGAELLEVFRDWKGNGVPFAFFSSQPSDARVVATAKKLGASVFRKPVDTAALVECLEGSLSLLDRKK